MRKLTINCILNQATRLIICVPILWTTHIEDIEKIAESLKDGDRLVFYREPENEHDPQAIRIETLGKEKIGYVPRQDNIVFSRLMDAGKLLFAKVIEKEMRGK